MYTLKLTYTDNEGCYHSIITDKITVTVDDENCIHYKCKQLVTNKDFDIYQNSAWIDTHNLYLGE